MKKKLVIVSVLYSFLIFCMMGCKKDQQSRQTQAEKVAHNQSLQRGYLSNIKVSQYGFLIFSSLSDVQEYLEFVKRSTHGELQDHLARIGFKSLGSTIYGKEFSSAAVTEEEAADYIVDAFHMFQVEEVVMKPIGETTSKVKWQFLLTMHTSNLNSESFEVMASGTYDADVMNKFATNSEDGSVNLFAFIKETPSGYEETTPNSAETKRPMFGETTTELQECGQSHYTPLGNCVRDCQIRSVRKIYIFWVGIIVDDNVTSSWSEASGGC